MTVIEEVRDLLEAAMDVAGEEQVVRLREAAENLDSPLRLAIAGRVKAGKSTLLNALVGEAVAPTDAAECTKVVTWYVDGLTYRAWMHPRDGDAIQVPFTREAGNAHIDISGSRLEEIDHLEVEFPSQNLEGLNLIDTPGTASVSEAVSGRAAEFLLDTNSSHVDVVIYLMRHLHDSDVDFLEAFSGEGSDSRPTMAIGVLSRADEIGGGRSDAMDIAAKAATTFSDDPRLRGRVQTVIPVAGLLAFAAATLREDEFQQLRVLARHSIEDIDVALASVDTFVTGTAVAVASEADRRTLVDRLGLHGIRFAVAQLLHGEVSSAHELALALEAHSGLGRLRALVHGLYASRQAVLKASLALGLVEEIVRDLPRTQSRKLKGEIERIRSTVLEFAELEALNGLRIDPPADLEDAHRLEAERVLGAQGTDSATRLGLVGDLDNDDIRALTLELIQGWHSIGERPLVSRELRTLVPVVIRALEQRYGAIPQNSPTAP